MKRLSLALLLLIALFLLLRLPLGRQTWTVAPPPAPPEHPHPRPPAFPEGWQLRSVRERLAGASTLLVSDGEARPAEVLRYDVAVLEPRQWDADRLTRLRQGGTLALARVSLTRVEADDPLFRRIPAGLQQRAEGPGPTLVIGPEDLWLQMLRREKLDGLLAAGFDGFVLADPGPLQLDDPAWTELRLFFIDLRTRWPQCLLILESDPALARRLAPLIDGLYVVGLRHAREKDPQIDGLLQNLPLARVLCLELLDLQQGDQVRTVWEEHWRRGYLTAVQASHNSSAISPRLAPESGRGFLRLENWPGTDPAPLVGYPSRRLAEGILVQDEIPAGNHSIVVDGRQESVVIVPGRTSYLQRP